jgi:predicted RND superfamily exporter protein
MKPWARIRSAVFALVDLGANAPYLVLGVALAILLACWGYARRLDVRSDVMELLPRDSPGFMAFEHRLERVGGQGTISILAGSPDRKANERFVDATAAALDRWRGEQTKCLATCNGAAACVHACGGAVEIAYLEPGSKEARQFFQDNKWLYAELAELEEADRKLDKQIAVQSGLVEDLESDEKAEATLGMDVYRDRWKKKADERDDFPTGYFARPDGTKIALWIVTKGRGMGGSEDDLLLDHVKKVVAGVGPASFHPAMTVGYGGDIPNAKAEKDSLISEAVMATSIAAALIFAALVWFYRSIFAIPIVFFPPLFGVGCAYAFATWRYGYVNSSGAFLGAIILGNGINYPIVLYSRYKEFRARGMPADVARRDAVWNAFRAELVGSCVASIAYGSLTVTRFRGFSQFGIIGFFGMLLVWISMIPCMPAMVVVIERLQEKLPAWAREKPVTLRGDESRGPVSSFVGERTARHPGMFVAAAVVATLLAAWKLPHFLHDPWEYDFDKLGSEGARKSGAFRVTNEAKEILRGKKHLEGTIVLADKVEQVSEVKARILANDAADPQGSLIEAVNTVWDYLPGTPAVQAQKLEVLGRIRDRITPNVLSRMKDEEADRLREMRPPEALHVLSPEDLPGPIRHRFAEKSGKIGTPFYVDFKPGVSTNDGHVLLRIAHTIDGVVLPDGTRVDTASRATVFAEMIRSLERDGPFATTVSFVAVVLVVLVATWSRRGAFAVVLTLVLGVFWTVGFGAALGTRLNFVNFIALPITFGIGSEYPFNIYDRSRLLRGDTTTAVKLSMGAVALCSYTTIIGYGSLLFADNQALRSFGKLSIAGEISCVLGALLLLPSVLHLLTRRFGPAYTTPAPQVSASQAPPP